MVQRRNRTAGQDGESGEGGMTTGERALIHTWLLALYEEHGMLTPELVREAARPSGSPGHGFVFNVPSEEAAEKYYLERAHRLLQLVRVRYDVQPAQPPVTVRAFHAVTGDERGIIYAPVEAVVERADWRAEVRQAAVRRLREAETALTELDAVMGNPTVTGKALRGVREARAMIEAA